MEVENQKPLIMTTGEHREDFPSLAGEKSPNLIDFSSSCSNNEPPAFKYGKHSESKSRSIRRNWKGDARQPSPSHIKNPRHIRE